MKELPIDLICVDGRPNTIDLLYSLQALRLSATFFKFNSVIFISPRKVFDFEGVHIQIDPLRSLAEYSEFMLKELGRCFSSDFCLTIQSDGFIVRPELWDDNFLNYDYIGAPWPASSPQAKINRVGNGGFSLRSKKLVELCEIFDNNISEETREIAQQVFHKNLQPHQIEDNMICVHKKKYLEENGIKFAPVEVASRFSLENPIPENQTGNSFGFHGILGHDFYLNFLHNSFNFK